MRNGTNVILVVDDDADVRDTLRAVLESGGYATLVTEMRAAGAPPPIYLLSSVGDALHASIDAGELGISGILQKPVDPAGLLRTVGTRLAVG